jgi:predicted nicotinamide N-methyase
MVFEWQASLRKTGRDVGFSLLVPQLEGLDAWIARWNQASTTVNLRELHLERLARQGITRREFSIQGVRLQIGEQPGMSVGSTVWTAAKVLSSFVLGNSEQFRDIDCIELGSGVGVVGLCAFYAGSSKVVLTEREEMMPLLQYNVEHAKKSAEACSVSGELSCVKLDWQSKSDCDALLQKNARFHHILASEIIYNKELFPAIRTTLLSLCDLDTRVWICCRPRKDDTSFWALIESDFMVDLIHQEQDDVNMICTET